MKKLISMLVALILILTAMTFVTTASAQCSEMYVVSKNGKGGTRPRRPQQVRRDPQDG